MQARIFTLPSSPSLRITQNLALAGATFVEVPKETIEEWELICAKYEKIQEAMEALIALSSDRVLMPITEAEGKKILDERTPQGFDGKNEVANSARLREMTGEPPLSKGYEEAHGDFESGQK